MPARRSKTYRVISLAGAPSVAPVVANPKRVSLFVQNTSGGVATMRFGEACQNNGSEINFTSNMFILWDQKDTVPTEGLNFFSAADATWCVIEGVGEEAS